jgi:hypothetical protein
MIQPEVKEIVTRPEFTAVDPDVQLYDIYKPYFEDMGGPIVPRTVTLPINGIVTEEGAAIFGRHFEVMARNRREWSVAGFLFNAVRIRLESEVPVSAEGETVFALPRDEFDEEESQQIHDGMVNRGLAIYIDRDSYDFPENVDSGRDFPRFTRVLEDGAVELVQEVSVPPIMVNEKIMPVGGLFVAVKRIYSTEYRQYQGDIKSTLMTLSTVSAITTDHQAHPSRKDSYRDSSGLEMSDDAIVERLNGQRPRETSFGYTIE